MSDKKEKGISINFGLESVEILNYDYKEPKQDISIEEVEYQVQFKLDTDFNKETISIVFKVTGQIGKEDPLEIGTIHTETTYKISEIDQLINDDGNLVIPKGLAVTLLSIALSTTRGALIAKSGDNILSKAILPLADPKEMYEASPLKGEIDIS